MEACGCDPDYCRQRQPPLGCHCQGPAAVNVLIVDPQPRARAALRHLLATLPEASNCRIDEASDAAHAQALLGAGNCHLLLLDIGLPGIDGLQLAAELRRHAPPERLLPALVFVTTHQEHALAAFDHGALDYLVKPIRRERLQRVLRRVAALRGIAAMPAAPATVMLRVPAPGALRRVALDDVLYFRADHKYTLLRTLHHAHLIDTPLHELAQRHGASFVRVHRGALAARDAIVALLHAPGAGWVLQLRGVPETLPVSRRQLPAVRALLR